MRAGGKANPSLLHIVIMGFLQRISGPCRDLPVLAKLGRWFLLRRSTGDHAGRIPGKPTEQRGNSCLWNVVAFFFRAGFRALVSVQLAGGWLVALISSGMCATFPTAELNYWPRVTQPRSTATSMPSPMRWAVSLEMSPPSNKLPIIPRWKDSRFDSEGDASETTRQTHQPGERHHQVLIQFSS